MIALKKLVHLVNPSWRYSPSKNGQNWPKMGQKSIFGPRGQQGGSGDQSYPLPQLSPWVGSHPRILVRIGDMAHIAVWSLFSCIAS